MRRTSETLVGDILFPDLGITQFVHFVKILHTVHTCALFCVCYKFCSPVVFENH